MKRANDAEATRSKILGTAFQEFYRHGFQGGSLNRIIDDAGVTKGSLFHHFDGKNALGYAVVDELLYEAVNEEWFKPLRDSTDPIADLKRIITSRAKQTARDGKMLCQGCPISNLAQEMSPLDKGFQKRLMRIFDHWRQSVATAIENGIKHGTVRKGVAPRAVAALLVATISGLACTVKNAQSPKLFGDIRQGLFGYLDNLKP